MLRLHRNTQQQSTQDYQLALARQMRSPSSAEPLGKQQLPLWILLAGLIITGLVTHAVWSFTSSRDHAEARIGFEARGNQIGLTLRERMREFEQALLGMSTIFSASTPLDQARWIAHFELLRLAEIHPGFQGIGYAPLVTRENRARHEAELRKNEYPDYTIRPDGEHPLVIPVIYFAPDMERNRTTIGFDMYHDASRRTAMDKARDRGQAIITQKVNLSQDALTESQPGFFMYLPLYRRDAAIATTTQRQKAIEGYIFSPFRMKDLLSRILAEQRDVRVEIFDGPVQRADTLMYDSDIQPLSGVAHAPRFSVVSVIPLYGSTWTLRVSTLPAFDSAINYSDAHVATAGATLICLLALTMIWSQLTLRRRAEVIADNITRDLAKSREQLELALEGSDLALFDWNMSTGEVQLSARWNLILGGNAEPVRTTLKALEALVPEEDQPIVTAQIKKLLTGRTDRYQAEHRVRRYDGTYIWIASNAKIVERDSMNRALRLVGTHMDVTKRHEMERMKSEFISNVSHELRTPITALTGALGLLQTGVVGPMPDKARTFLDMAYQNGERLSAIVNDILTLEDTTAGRATLNIKPLNVAAFLEHAVSVSTGLAKKKEIALSLQTVPPSLEVKADRERLLQVLTNLLSNAIKFSPTGAVVTLAAEPRGQCARISVIDHGSGIPPEFRSRIFERFAQGDGSSTRAQGGTGLGLAVCKTLVELLGGQIGFVSEAGAGTTFYIDLPMSGDEVAQVYL